MTALACLVTRQLQILPRAARGGADSRNVRRWCCAASAQRGGVAGTGAASGIVSKVSNSYSCLSPKAAPRDTAPENAIIDCPRRRFTNIFMALPLPTSPRCLVFFPIAPNRGWHMETCSLIPPTRKINSPDSAGPRLPATGTSIQLTPSSRAAFIRWMQRSKQLERYRLS